MTDTHGLRKLHADTVPIKWASAAGDVWNLLPEMLDEIDRLRDVEKGYEEMNVILETLQKEIPGAMEKRDAHNQRIGREKLLVSLLGGKILTDDQRGFFQYLLDGVQEELNNG